MIERGRLMAVLYTRLLVPTHEKRIVLICGPLRVAVVGRKDGERLSIAVLYARPMLPTHKEEDECTYECKNGKTCERTSGDRPSVG